MKTVMETAFAKGTNMSSAGQSQLETQTLRAGEPGGHLCTDAQAMLAARRKSICRP